MHVTAQPAVRRIGSTILKSDRGEDWEYDEIRDSPDGKLWAMVADSIYEPYLFAVKVFERTGLEARAKYMQTRKFMRPGYHRRRKVVDQVEVDGKWWDIMWNEDWRLTGWRGTGMVLKELKETYDFAHGPVFSALCNILGYDKELRLRMLGRLGAKVRKLRDA